MLLREHSRVFVIQSALKGYQRAHHLGGQGGLEYNNTTFETGFSLLKNLQLLSQKYNLPIRLKLKDVQESDL